MVRGPQHVLATKERSYSPHDFHGYHDIKNRNCKKSKKYVHLFSYAPKEA